MTDCKCNCAAVSERRHGIIVELMDTLRLRASSHRLETTTRSDQFTDTMETLDAYIAGMFGKITSVIKTAEEKALLELHDACRAPIKQLSNKEMDGMRKKMDLEKVLALKKSYPTGFTRRFLPNFFLNKNRKKLNLHLLSRLIGRFDDLRDKFEPVQMPSHAFFFIRPRFFSLVGGDIPKSFVVCGKHDINREYPITTTASIIIGRTVQDRPHGTHVLTVHPSTREIYASCGNPYQIKVYSPTGQLIRSFGRSGYGENNFHHTHGLLFSTTGDELMSIECGLSIVRVVDLDGNLKKVIGRPGGRPLEFASPHFLDTDAEGFVYIADRDNKRVQKVTFQGEFVQFIADPDSKYHQTKIIDSLCINDEQELMVITYNADRVRVFDLKGEFLRDIPIEPVRDWTHISRAPNGGFLVCDYSNHNIRFYDRLGNKLQQLRTDSPRFAIFDYQARLLVCNTSSNTISIY